MVVPMARERPTWPEHTPQNTSSKEKWCPDKKDTSDWITKDRQPAAPANFRPNTCFFLNFHNAAALLWLLTVQTGFVVSRLLSQTFGDQPINHPPECLEHLCSGGSLEPSWWMSEIGGDMTKHMRNGQSSIVYHPTEVNSQMEGWPMQPLSELSMWIIYRGWWNMRWAHVRWRVLEIGRE